MLGKVEAANGGTLFLDEVGELPLQLQAKLLRFVQERQFERVGGRETLTADVRIVAATNRDLEAMVAQGQFRSDLFFRLRVVELEIPPLRARGEDIADLADHFVQQLARRYRKSPLRLDARRPRGAGAYAWPGNVRELENTIERAVVLARGPVIGVKDLALDERRQASQVIGLDGVTLPHGLTLEDAERRYAVRRARARGRQPVGGGTRARDQPQQARAAASRLAVSCSGALAGVRSSHAHRARDHVAPRARTRRVRRRSAGRRPDAAATRACSASASCSASRPA